MEWGGLGVGTRGCGLVKPKPRPARGQTGAAAPRVGKRRFARTTGLGRLCGALRRRSQQRRTRRASREPDSPERNDAVNVFGDELIAAARDVLRQELAELRVPPHQAELFFDAYDEEQARRAVTEDLDDETWEIRVEMPGEIVAHNATDCDERGVTWAFPAKVLHDRDHVLMVTSRVTRGAPRQIRSHDEEESEETD